MKLYKFRVAEEFISVSRKGSQTCSRSRGWFIALLDSGPPQQFRLFFHCFRSRQDVRSWLGLRMEKNPLSSAKLGPPPGPGGANIDMMEHQSCGPYSGRTSSSGPPSAGNKWNPQMHPATWDAPHNAIMEPTYAPLVKVIIDTRKISSSNNGQIVLRKLT